MSTAFRSSIKNKRIIFFHAPKCGGTSVNQVLKGCFGLQRAITRHGIVQIEPHATRLAAEMTGRNIHTIFEHILAYYLQLESTRYISGHINYSTHIDSIAANAWDYITILRKPESRFVSHFFYDANKPNRDHFAIETGIEEFIETPRAETLGVTFVSMLMGAPSVNDGHELLNIELLRQGATITAAKENLDKFAIVGTLEKLAEFEAAINRRYAIAARIPHHKRNPLANYPKFGELPEHLRSKIEKICEPDREIYEHALKRVQGET